MTLELSTDRALIRHNGKSRRHLVVRWTAPPVADSVTRPPLRAAFSIDRSGSMGGDRIVLARQGVAQAIEELAPTDAFSVTAFDGGVETILPLSPATPVARATAIAALAAVDARGSTNLFRGFLSACETVAGPGEGTARCFLLTDGHATDEERDPVKLAGHALALRDRGISLCTFGIGIGFDEVLLRGMADAGGGNFFYIASAQDIPGVMRRELSEALIVSQRGVVVRLALPTGTTARLVGSHRLLAEDHTAVSVGDLVADEQIELVFSLQFPPGDVGRQHAVRATLTDDSGQTHSAALPFTYADTAANDHQPRDLEADRLIAQRHADRARLLALQLNADHRYPEAAQLLAGVEARIREYAGSDPVLNALAAELQRDGVAYARRLDELMSKEHHMTNSSRSRGKLAEGFARRRPQDP